LRIWLTGFSVKRSSPTNCGKLIVFASDSAAGAAEAAAAGAADGLKFSTSFLTIRPFSAEPFTWLKSIPFSLAIFLAKGEALILESIDEEDAARGSSDLLSCSTGFTSSFLDSELEPAEDFWFNKGVTSVPAGPTIAMISLTFAACPASRPTYNRVPSPKAVTSIVALSVSTSAIASSDLMVSPTLKFH